MWRRVLGSDRFWCSPWDGLTKPFMWSAVCFESLIWRLGSVTEWSGLGLYHLPLLLQSLGVKWRHFGSMRKCLFCIALSCPSTMSSERVRMYWPWIQEKKQSQHFRQNVPLCFLQHAAIKKIWIDTTSLYQLLGLEYQILFISSAAVQKLFIHHHTTNK